LPVIVTTDIKSGIITDRVFEDEPKGYRVVWIDWDSDFRNTDLQIGDLITGVDGKKYERIKDANVSALAIGQHLEYIGWERAGAKDGQEITLDVIRRGQERLQIRGKLRSEKIYSQDDNRRSLSPNGPPTLSNDGFSNAWSTWYENFTKKASYILDSVWERWGTFNNIRELTEQEDLKPRIDYLLKNYPGQFADSVLADWNKVKQYLVGPKIEPNSVDLQYREIGAKRVQAAKDAAGKSYQALLAEVADESIQPFPAKEVDSRNEVVGKVVELPWITFRNFINDLGRSYAVIGSSRDGFYFVDIASAEMNAFFGTWFRFKASVNPNISERYRIIGRILDDPRILTYQQQPAKGLMIRVLGVLSGDGDLFVDLRNVKAGGDTAPFAGEDLLANTNQIQISDDASPAQVIETMINAIKYADEDRWKNLFASWRVFTKEDMIMVDSSYTQSSTALKRDWEFSRKLINNQVYDARVGRVSPVRVLSQGTPDGKIPKIEQVTVFIFHIGFFNGEYKAFSDLSVQRLWRLQRINGGPWRIVESNHL
jgi:hypothetical protein